MQQAKRFADRARWVLFSFFCVYSEAWYTTTKLYTYIYIYISINGSMLDAHVRRIILCKWIIMVRSSMIVMDGRNVRRLMFSRNNIFSRDRRLAYYAHSNAPLGVLNFCCSFVFLLFCKLNAKMRANGNRNIGGIYIYVVRGMRFLRWTGVLLYICCRYL